MSGLFAWVMIGAAAALAAMIWPSRRGIAGIVLNLVAGIGGAVIVGLLSLAIAPRACASGPCSTRLLFAALGAVAGLLVNHFVWARRAAARPPPRRPAHRASE